MPVGAPPLPRPATVTPRVREDDHATATDLARRGGGPQHRALYECACGSVFTAPVSTSVGCPDCGGGQAW